MLDIKPTQKAFPVLVLPSLNNHDALNRLLAAAAISPRFCSLLLEDPFRAIQDGFQGEDFQLSNEEFALLLSTNANSLAGLADQIAHALNEQQRQPMQSSAPSFFILDC